MFMLILLIAVVATVSAIIRDAQINAKPLHTPKHAFVSGKPIVRRTRDYGSFYVAVSIA